MVTLKLTTDEAQALLDLLNDEIGPGADMETLLQVKRKLTK